MKMWGIPAGTNERRRCREDAKLHVQERDITSGCSMRMNSFIAVGMH